MDSRMEGIHIALTLFSHTRATTPHPMTLLHQVILVAFAAMFLANDTEAVRGALIRHGRAGSLPGYVSQVDDEVQPTSYDRSVGLRYSRPNIAPIPGYADDWGF